MTLWTGGRPLEVLTFDIEGEMFAVEAGHIREILDLVPITEVPQSQPFVRGLINVRGRVVPLADLRVRFGMAQKPPTVDTRIIVLEIELEGEPLPAAIRADKVYEVTELAASELQQTPRIGLKWPPEFIRCIGKRGDEFMVVLDIAKVFAGPAQSGSDTASTPREHQAA